MRNEGFVQVDWAPAEAVPARVEEEIDVDGDGQSDFALALDTQTSAASLTPRSPRVLGLQGCYRLQEAWAVRVNLRNSQR